MTIDYFLKIDGFNTIITDLRKSTRGYLKLYTFHVRYGVGCATLWRLVTILEKADIVKRYENKVKLIKRK